MTLTLLHLIAAICLLLWSTKLVHHSMTQAFGGRLRAVLSQNTANRFRAFGTGFAITALLQSSTATMLMTLSFVRQSLMGLSAALAVVIGADFSTTMVAQILSLDLSWLSPMLLIVGFITAARSDRGSKTASIGHMLTGLGLILLSLTLMRETMSPLQDSPILVQMLEGLRDEPALALIFSAILTFLMHSSLATILFYSAMASQGIIDLDLAILLILGANVGSSFIPFALTYKDVPRVKRLTIINLVMRTALALALLPLVPMIGDFVQSLGTDTSRHIVNLHTSYSILMCVIALPFLPFIAKAGYKIIKPSSKGGSHYDALYLDETMLDKPTIALSSAAREALRMADIVQSMTEKAFKALTDHDEDLLNQAKQDDQQLDALFNSLKIFLSRLHHDALSSDEMRKVHQIMAFATNLEHCGDIIQHSMSDTIMKKVEARDQFSPEGWTEIKGFYNAVIANMQTAQSVLISHSTQLAGEMIDTKKHLKTLEFESRRKHFNRLSNQQPQSLATSSIHIDLMRDLGRINSHMTAIAYEIMND